MKINYEEIEKIIINAGDILMSACLQKDEIFAKEGPANYVTVYDVKIQKYLIQEFSKLLPMAKFYGEEDTEGNSHDNVNVGFVFYIDPIDGTTNFLYDYMHSCISVGLSQDGVMIAGFVYNPYTKIMYKGIKSEGAYVNNKRVMLENTKLMNGIAEFGCARYNDDRVDYMFKIVKELFMRSVCIRNGGSAALGISRIASGSNALFFELKLQPYDYAAASVIVEEAGGRICQIDGTSITIDAPCSIVAGTKAATTEMLDIVKSML